MDDLIKRSDAIDAIRASTSKYTGFMQMEMYTDDDAVEAIQNVRSAQQWIPCSERLPEENRKVLVTDVFGVYIGEFVDAEEKWGGEHFINEHGMHSKSVIAWMPLPEAYKESGAE